MDVVQLLQRQFIDYMKSLFMEEMRIRGEKNLNDRV
ncbi:hypothetical protein BVRB_1g022340 [Beta vulgaris subsp. vulgaris]|nr:hypothetical protein BVRB_1g022340 [Beta vulgaris subsp. vulgaris]